MTRYKIGYWWSEKKSQRLNAHELEQLFAERECEFVKLDLDRPLDEQGPFALIVHKISDFLVKADQGDLHAKKTVSAFESYVRKHPETVILDPLDNNRALLDRYKQYRLIEQSGLAKEGVVFTPPFVHLTSTNIDVNRGRIRRSKLTFPLVCKPILAQGSTGAHQMCIIFNEAGLKDLKPPCVAQSFVNHNAKLFKLFVIKDKYYIAERPSLKNFRAGDHETVFFYSHDISKPNSSSSLTELDEEDKLNLEALISRMSEVQVSSSSSEASNELDKSNHKLAINNNGFEDSSNNNKAPSHIPKSLLSLDESGSGVNSNQVHQNDYHPKTQQQQQQQYYGFNQCNNNSNDLTLTKTPEINRNAPLLEEASAISRPTTTNLRDNDSTSHSVTINPQSDYKKATKNNNNHLTTANQYKSPLLPSDERLSTIVKTFSEKLGLTFYGIDIIIENETSRYAIIDMNTFPGYDGVDNFLSIFRDVVCDAIPNDSTDHQYQLMQQRLNPKRKPTEIDSGIEST